MPRLPDQPQALPHAGRDDARISATEQADGQSAALSPRRVMIVGGSGSGKSTLARRLGTKLGLPVYHMDREVHWLPGWQERPRDEKPARVAEIVARDAWVFEGGHSTSYQMRLARADLLIWTDAPLWRRMGRITWRAIRERGVSRPDLADDCPERLRMLPEFWWYLWVNRRRIDQRLAALYASATISKRKLTGFPAIEAFLARL
ncbi:MAG: hypothetical protein AAF626_07930 [Pseudomonadota bacterium]